MTYLVPNVLEHNRCDEHNQEVECPVAEDDKEHVCVSY